MQPKGQQWGASQAGSLCYVKVARKASAIFLFRRGVRISLEQFNKYCDLNWGPLEVLTGRGDRLNMMLTSLAKRMT